MEDEPYLEQLIDALQELRARVIQVRPDQQSEIEPAPYSELQSMLISAFAISSRLGTSRSPDLPPDASLKKIADVARIRGEILEQDMERTRALRAISPDFSVQAIDDAISVAASQRDC